MESRRNVGRIHPETTTFFLCDIQVQLRAAGSALTLIV